jgi:hypothetical protein
VNEISGSHWALLSLPLSVPWVFCLQKKARRRGSYLPVRRLRFWSRICGRKSECRIFVTTIHEAA